MSVKSIAKEFILFLIGGFIYVLIELAFRGYSHWTMFLLGGICFILIGLLNNSFDWDMCILSQMIISAGIVTVLEFIFGCILNLWLNLDIWDYSNMPYNLLGQICLLFTNLWFLLSLVAILLDDYIRYWLFHEDKPRYHLF